MNPRILIVDDEPFMLRLIETSLKKAGFDLISCRSGEQALDLAAQQRPSLIIMDLMMPGMDGFTTLQHLKAKPDLGKVPVIMLTAKGHKFTQEKAEEGGVDAFLTKPFSPSQLVEEARKLIAKGTAL